MSDVLSKERIEELRDYTAGKLESLVENTQHPAQDQARRHAETILALIAEREEWADDAHPTSLRGQWLELRRRRAEVDGKLDRLERENAALIAERERREGAETVCTHCQTKAASCIGQYDNMAEAAPACDDCCGHGCEDGHCDQINGETILELHKRIDGLVAERDRLLALAEAVAKYEAALKRETFAPDDEAAQIAAAEVRIAHVKMLNALDAWKAVR